jgi:hypothetical protein
MSRGNFEDELDYDFDTDYQDYQDYENYEDNDYSDEGCGEGFSCSRCNNYGCPAHPCN